MLIRGPSKYSCSDGRNDMISAHPQPDTKLPPPPAREGEAYLSLARCPYSAEFAMAVKHYGLNVHVVDIDVCQSPPWLPGVPTVLDANGDGFCGDAAFDWLQSKIAEPPAVRQSGSDAAGPATRPSSAPSANGMPPEPQPFSSLSDKKALGTSIADAYSSMGNEHAVNAGDAMLVSQNSEKLDDAFSKLMECLAIQMLKQDSYESPVEHAASPSDPAFANFVADLVADLHLGHATPDLTSLLYRIVVEKADVEPRDLVDIMVSDADSADRIHITPVAMSTHAKPTEVRPSALQLVSDMNQLVNELLNLEKPSLLAGAMMKYPKPASACNNVLTASDSTIASATAGIASHDGIAAAETAVRSAYEGIICLGYGGINATNHKDYAPQLSAACSLAQSLQSAVVQLEKQKEVARTAGETVTATGVERAAAKQERAMADAAAAERTAAAERAATERAAAAERALPAQARADAAAAAERVAAEQVRVNAAAAAERAAADRAVAKRAAAEQARADAAAAAERVAAEQVRVNAAAAAERAVAERAAATVHTAAAKARADAAAAAERAAAEQARFDAEAAAKQTAAEQVRVDVEAANERAAAEAAAKQARASIDAAERATDALPPPPASPHFITTKPPPPPEDIQPIEDAEDSFYDADLPPPPQQTGSSTSPPIPPLELHSTTNSSAETCRSFLDASYHIPEAPDTIQYRSSDSKSLRKSKQRALELWAIAHISKRDCMRHMCQNGSVTADAPFFATMITYLDKLKKAGKIEQNQKFIQWSATFADASTGLVAVQDAFEQYRQQMVAVGSAAPDLRSNFEHTLEATVEMELKKVKQKGGVSSTSLGKVVLGILAAGTVCAPLVHWAHPALYESGRDSVSHGAQFMHSKLAAAGPAARSLVNNTQSGAGNLVKMAAAQAASGAAALSSFNGWGNMPTQPSANFIDQVQAVNPQFVTQVAIPKAPAASMQTPVDISDQIETLKLQRVQAAMSQSLDIMQLRQISKDIRELGTNIPVDTIRFATMATEAETRYHDSMDTLAHIDGGSDLPTAIANVHGVNVIVNTYMHGAPICGDGSCIAGPTALDGVACCSTLLYLDKDMATMASTALKKTNDKMVQMLQDDAVTYELLHQVIAQTDGADELKGAHLAAQTRLADEQLMEAPLKQLGQLMADRAPNLTQSPRSDVARYLVQVSQGGPDDVSDLQSAAQVLKDAGISKLPPSFEEAGVVATERMATKAVSNLYLQGLQNAYQELPLQAISDESEAIKDGATSLINALHEADQGVDALLKASEAATATDTAYLGVDFDQPLQKAGVSVVKSLVAGAWSTGPEDVIAMYTKLPARVKSEETNELISGLRSDVTAMSAIEAINSTAPAVQAAAKVNHGLDASGNTIETYSSALQQLQSLHSNANSDSVRDAAKSEFSALITYAIENAASQGEQIGRSALGLINGSTPSRIDMYTLSNRSKMALKNAEEAGVLSNQLDPAAGTALKSALTVNRDAAWFFDQFEHLQKLVTEATSSVNVDANFSGALAAAKLFGHTLAPLDTILAAGASAQLSAAVAGITTAPDVQSQVSAISSSLGEWMRLTALASKAALPDAASALKLQGANLVTAIRDTVNGKEWHEWLRTQASRIEQIVKGFAEAPQLQLQPEELALVAACGVSNECAQAQLMAGLFDVYAERAIANASDIDDIKDLRAFFKQVGDATQDAPVIEYSLGLAGTVFDAASISISNLAALHAMTTPEAVAQQVGQVVGDDAIMLQDALEAAETMSVEEVKDMLSLVTHMTPVYGEKAIRDANMSAEQVADNQALIDIGAVLNSLEWPKLAKTVQGGWSSNGKKLLDLLTAANTHAKRARVDAVDDTKEPGKHAKANADSGADARMQAIAVNMVPEAEVLAEAEPALMAAEINQAESEVNDALSVYHNDNVNQPLSQMLTEHVRKVLRFSTKPAIRYAALGILTVAFAGAIAAGQMEMCKALATAPNALMLAGLQYKAGAAAGALCPIGGNALFVGATVAAPPTLAVAAAAARDRHLWLIEQDKLFQVFLRWKRAQLLESLDFTEAGALDSVLAGHKVDGLKEFSKSYADNWAQVLQNKEARNGLLARIDAAELLFKRQHPAAWEQIKGVFP
ncbi:hypothetical protein JKP88DRAFT_307558 [Tribonema minus]|uniref:Uncharacterized protein n=1 Tax=Tribonema minus TaxID=303371 RepID=A0A835Z5D3_9STRA|nr:hypothetical protein JKP88DRAFT_307558 [Tribonema minus]